MNVEKIKEGFIHFLSQNIGNLSFEEQRDILLKIQSEWIPEYYNLAEGNYTKCVHCKKALPTHLFTHKSVEELHKDVFIEYPLDPNENEAIYGDVKYLVEYIICPMCNCKKQISKKELEILNHYLK